MSKSLEDKLTTVLLILRITLGVFLLQWGIEKFVLPDVAQKIYGHFYFIDLDISFTPYIGVLQTALALAILTGFQKKYSYLIGFAIHAVSTVSTWKYLIAPYDQGNHLFMTAVPVLAGFWLLYTLRDADTKWSIDAMRNAAETSD